MPRKCHITPNKVRYKSQAKAISALLEYNVKNGRLKTFIELTEYKCPSCDGWHLTSKGGYSKAQKKHAVEMQRRLEQEEEYWKDKFKVTT